jgi:F0F1-type ATP synthase membrane subunit b/b'
MKKQQDNKVNQAPAVGTDTQLQQLRKNIKAQVEELKRTVSVIQQQSLKEVQDAVSDAFKTFTSDSLQQLSKQDAAIKQQLDQAVQEVDKLVPANSVLQTTTDAGRKAVEQAQISVRNAIASSMSSMEEAQKAQQLPTQAGNQQQTITP